MKKAILGVMTAAAVLTAVPVLAQEQESKGAFPKSTLLIIAGLGAGFTAFYEAVKTGDEDEAPDSA